WKPRANFEEYAFSADCRSQRSLCWQLPRLQQLDIDAGELALAMPAGSKAEFHAASAVVAEALENIQNLPVIPREIQDILSITTTERHRWLK
ncbi:hypothetical protein ACC734_38025, partial [Rhizobium ruizarguesonis]